MMRIINTKKYDTETATYIDDFTSTEDYNRTNFNFYREALYKKRTGEYFLYIEGWGVGRGRGYDEKICPITLDKAKKWVEENSSGELYEELFGEVQE